VNRAYLQFFLPFWWEHILERNRLDASTAEERVALILQPDPAPAQTPPSPAPLATTPPPAEPTPWPSWPYPSAVPAFYYPTPEPLLRTSPRAPRTVDPRSTRPLSTTALTAQTSKASPAPTTKASSPPSRWTSYHPPPWPTRCSPYRSVVARSPSCVRSLVELAAPRPRCSQ
jgi:hypothetical protein